MEGALGKKRRQLCCLGGSTATCRKMEERKAKKKMRGMLNANCGLKENDT